MSERSSKTYWGRPVEYSAEFIAHYIERLRKAKGPIEECSPLEEVDPKILEPYAISEQDENVRAYLVEVIWQHRRPELVPFLARVLNDPSKKVWKVALDGLVVLGTDDALVALKAARAGASAKKLEYIDEAIDQIEHPKAWMDIEPECPDFDEELGSREQTSRRLIEAKVTFLSAGEGGRDHPANNSSAYRPHLVVGDPGRRGIVADDDRMSENYLAVSFSGDGGRLLPDRSYNVRLLLVFYPHSAYGALASGATFTIREGPKIVGYGRVTKVIDEAVT